MFLANMVSISAAQDVIELSKKCALGREEYRYNDKPCKELDAAFLSLTDQTELARIAVGLNYGAESRAVKKLTDQTLLAKVAIEAEDLEAAVDAVGKLTDQALLAKVAIEASTNEWGKVRVAAVKKLTDQELLTNVAILGDRRWIDRSGAVEKIADQTLLAKVATEAENPYVCFFAFQKLTDQTLLGKVAALAKLPDVRVAAVRKLTDQVLLARIASMDKDRDVRVEAIAAMDGSNPALMRLANLAHGPNYDAVVTAARMMLAIQSPPIRKRFPRIAFASSVERFNQSYGTYAGVWGELVWFVLNQDGVTLLAKRKWTTDFPGVIEGRGGFFLPAKVRGQDLLVELLGNAAFTRDDLVELSSSGVPELRSAARQRLAEFRVGTR
jgi:hypothetical protein